MKKGFAWKCVGLAFVKCQLDDTANILEDVDVGTLQSRMKHYCLILPLLEDGDFDEEFVIVYDDCDVDDDFFQKCLPSLCTMCFKTDVL